MQKKTQANIGFEDKIWKVNRLQDLMGGQVKTVIV